MSPSLARIRAKLAITSPWSTRYSRPGAARGPQRRKRRKERTVPVRGHSKICGQSRCSGKHRPPRSPYCGAYRGSNVSAARCHIPRSLRELHSSRPGARPSEPACSRSCTSGLPFVRRPLGPARALPGRLTSPMSRWKLVDQETGAENPGRQSRTSSNPGRWMAHCHIAEHHGSRMTFSSSVTD